MFKVVANVDDDSMLRSMLDSGLFDFNLRDRNGCSALHFAAMLGKDTAVSLLLVSTVFFQSIPP